ncbi:hypothetical protein [Anabaena azotica]|uniref:Uncharacterized protein n=1 Tax=Anabaena azotica FACHB-119 TaxID=947527 RepID=A0ABR8CXU4_9NOST|nr:hypothetical protein [Anabaena azotica]MBD2499486.1 hypothetical protein [Anabaena azotica FACHB-119]
MKLLKIALVVLVMLVNLVIAPPSWADPNYQENPDYIEVTKTLKNLLSNAQGTIPEDVQRQISELKFQKDAIKSGLNWGQCRNETGGNLAIYGTGSEESEESEKSLIQFLADGQTTPEQWDCQGVYFPGDVKVSGLEKTGAVAIKVMDGTQLLVKKDPDSSELKLNLPSVTIVNPEESNWLIPNISQAFVDSRIPNQFSGGDNG